ncbi:hypothetical protein IAI10_16160 [Clostridium sp. 19966]|uniref:hypothetical protein n=1 Tax=Clostridium sp. 19966 TaxID=2768166 RepID=UPI0028DF82D1|nr:hypothetical protein [Clostridium sp. 19966]MDT8718201.1 hypothetical protein [Clostridium sp. 19966]
MDSTFYIVTIFCITVICVVAIVSMFFYKQENYRLNFKHKLKKDNIMHEVSVDLDKNKKGNE